MPVLRVEMPAELEFLLYRRMFLNIERNFYGFFKIKNKNNLGSGPFFRHGRGRLPISFLYVAKVIITSYISLV